VSKKRRTRAPERITADDILDQLLGALMAALRAGDLLEAEVAAARCMALGYLTGMNPDRSDGILVKMARQGGRPEDAALLRLITALGRPSVKRTASRALADLTSAGVYPAEWVADAGKANPVSALRRGDIFGDQETIVVHYAYGDAEHMIGVMIDRTDLPTVINIDVSADTKDPFSSLMHPDFDREQDITLAEARRRMEPALLYGLAEDVASIDQVGDLIIARTRLRRLPAPDEAATPVFTAADRAAAVGEFMNSPQAADAVAADEEATRFWAEILTSYNTRIPGEPPVQIGPGKLERIVPGNVPDLCALTPRQRAQLRPAVTAWARWSADYRGLGDKAADHLASELRRAFEAFDLLYDEQEAVRTRAYTADLTDSYADLSALRDALERRLYAMPYPDERDADEHAADLDATDPADRRAYAAAEFGGCDHSVGVPRGDFLVGVQRVIEELWSGEPAGTWQEAKRLADGGLYRHEIIHELEQRSRSRHS
jgi:hypothetical protein